MRNIWFSSGIWDVTPVLFFFALPFSLYLNPNPTSFPPLRPVKTFLRGAFTLVPGRSQIFRLSQGIRLKPNGSRFVHVCVVTENVNFWDLPLSPRSTTSWVSCAHVLAQWFLIKSQRLHICITREPYVKKSHSKLFINHLTGYRNYDKLSSKNVKYFFNAFTISLNYH